MGDTEKPMKDDAEADERTTGEQSPAGQTQGGPHSGARADRIFRLCARGAGILILLVLAAVTLFLIIKAFPAFIGDGEQRTRAIDSLSGGRASGFWQYVGPLVFGTVLIAGLALLMAFPVAVGIALFISHYAPAKLSTVLSYVVDLLAEIGRAHV